MTKHDKETCEIALITLISKVNGIPRISAIDLINETERVINDIKSGERDDYLCPADVLSEYLGLGDEYLPIFE